MAEREQRESLLSELTFPVAPGMGAVLHSTNPNLGIQGFSRHLTP